MEASCFCTSKSFSNAPSLRPKGFLNLRKRFGQTLFGFNGTTPSTVTYCRSGSESTSDNSNTLIQSDWRSFRAKLVANEQPLNLPDLTNESTPISKLSSKWAHPLSEPEKGCLLIATDKLNGVHIFERTVILVLSMGPLGPMGVILNWPSLMSIKETRSISPDMAGTFSGRPLFFGGPLEENIFLLGPEETDGVVGKSGVFEEVMKGLYYGTRESIGCAAEMVKREMIGVEEFRFFDGYCAWEREKLKEEVSAGFWKVVACSSSVIAEKLKRGKFDEVGLNQIL